MTNTKRLLAAAFLSLPLLAAAQQEATPPPTNSQTQTHLRVNVKDDTQAIHFINTNNDPEVFTKTYVLKHADPYELRPYLMSAVRSRRIQDDKTKIEVVKYMDGTSILIVSAEDYRFGKQEVGMGIDEIIQTLDKPNIASSSGHRFTLYFPKYWDARSLATAMFNVGLQRADDPYELDGGKDRQSVDDGLNAILFFLPPSNIKTVEERLKLYDTPTFEASIKYSIYELEHENDGTIGVDFQAWKNGPGADLFAVSARYANGWDFVNMQPARAYMDNSYTRYINFSPKWNTKYLDFLAAKGKAKVITSGELTIMNNTEGYIENITKLATIADGAQIDPRVTLSEYQLLKDVIWQVNETANADNNNRYRINGAIDAGGNTLNMLRSDGTFVNSAQIDFSIVKNTIGSDTCYYMEILADGGTDAVFMNNAGKNYGKSVKAYNVKLQRCLRTAYGTYSNVVAPNGGDVIYTYAWTDQTTWTTDQNFKVLRSVKRKDNVSDYGFKLSLKPTVCDKATQLDILVSNTSLLGFKSDGTPRTNLSEFKTTVMVSNEGEKFVIGGIDKKTVVRSVDKVPYLGDIPGLGWAFASEKEVTKNSQLVAAIECRPMLPNTELKPKVRSTLSKTKEKIDKAGIKKGFIDQNDYGYDQFLLDSEKKKLDPLP